MWYVAILHTNKILFVQSLPEHEISNYLDSSIVYEI
jgi:hypothetical protein